MQTSYEFKTEISCDHRLSVDLPREIPLGKVKVTIVYESTPPQEDQDVNPVSTSEFVGLLESSPCFEGDPVALQRTMRDEWD
jgi:hypothetical protein